MQAGARQEGAGGLQRMGRQGPWEHWGVSPGCRGPIPPYCCPDCFWSRRSGQLGLPHTPAWSQPPAPSLAHLWDLLRGPPPSCRGDRPSRALLASSCPPPLVQDALWLRVPRGPLVVSTPRGSTEPLPDPDTGLCSLGPRCMSILPFPEIAEHVESLLTWVLTGRHAQRRSFSRCHWAEGPWLFLGSGPGWSMHVGGGLGWGGVSSNSSWHLAGPPQGLSDSPWSLLRQGQGWVRG